MHVFRRISLALVVLILTTPEGPGTAVAQTPPIRYALVIGVNDFVNLNGRLQALRFAKADAADVARVLEARGYKVTALINEGARRQDIIGHLNRLARTVRPEDSFLLFFAGHGVQNLSISESSTYWLTHDARLDAPDVEGIRLEHLMDYVRDVRAARKLVLLDHCFSGRVNLRPAGSGSLDATQPGGARGGPDENITVSRGSEPVPGWETVKARGQGIVLIGAARELAYESEKVGHGLFTAALLKALDSPEADTNPTDSKLSVLELIAYLPGALEKLAKTYNVPQQLEPMMEGRSLGAWELIDGLPRVANPQATRDAFQATLGRWAARFYITPRHNIRLSRVVDKVLAAQVAGTPIDPVERALFEAMKEYMEDSAPEEDRGKGLAKHFDAVCQMNAQSEICR